MEGPSEALERPARVRLRAALGILLVPVALALVIAYFVFSGESPLELVTMARADVVAAGVGSYWLTVLARTWRLRILLGRAAVPFADLFHLQAVSGLLGVFSPARAGEAVKIGWLARGHGVPLERAAVAFGVEKTQDLASYALFAVGTVLVLGSEEIVPEWLRQFLVPALAVLGCAAALALLLQVRGRRELLGQLPWVLLATLAVGGGVYLSVFATFALHGVVRPGAAFAVLSITLVAGALSMLPGGGQGVVQFAFHHAACDVFGVPERTVVSMVLHITLCFYLGASTACLLAPAWKRMRRTVGAGNAPLP